MLSYSITKAWPIALKGNDMICVAKTGSGKTCGFLLPTIHQHQQGGSSNRGPRKPVLLVLAPTRELACQIMEETQKFGRALGITSVCCYGGSSKYPQIAQLQRGVDCVIATPGRINDLLEMRKADLSGIKYLVSISVEIIFRYSVFFALIFLSRFSKGA